MPTNSYLHNLKDFRDLIQVVSSELRILPQLVEKDYWIMHVLYGLAKQGFDKQQESGGFPVNFLRHYYDIYCLLADARVQAFIGTETYEQRKEQRFRKEDVRKISENQAFLLQNPEVFQRYKSEYAKTEGLYYAGMISFGVIMERIRKNFDRL